MAFSAGILSHLVADSLVGFVPPLFPLSNFQIGIDLGLPSPADTVLEVGGLILVCGVSYLNDDYKLVTQANRQGIYLAIPLVSIVTLTLLFAGDSPSIILVSFAFSRKALTLISLGHIFLAGFLGAGVAQGIRAKRGKKSGTVSSHTNL